MEGFGIPPSEAMAVGTPVLASNNSSLPEVGPNPHCLFDPTSSEELCEKLRLAAEASEQFTAQLPHTFTAGYGVPRYLELLSEIGLNRSEWES